MTWINLIMGALKAISALSGFLETRGLLQAGAAQAISAGLTKTLADVKRAQAVRDAAADRHRKDQTDAAFDNDFREDR